MKMERRKKIWLTAEIAAIAMIILAGAVKIHTLSEEKKAAEEKLQSEVQQGIAKEVFRLHVVANSDRDEDQTLKLHVKTRIVDYLEDLLGENPDLEETKEGALTHLKEIEEAAEEVIKAEGYDYKVTAAVENTYFPDKTYGDCTFPAGEYEALNVKIGQAAGHNWWCVLYPTLCFIDDAHGIVSEEKKEKLKDVLTEEEFLSILTDPKENKKVRIAFKWF